MSVHLSSGLPRLTPATAVAVLGTAAAVSYVAGLSWGAGRLSYDVWFSVAVWPLLLILGIVVLRRWTRSMDDPWLFQLAVVALVVKLFSALARYYMAWELYTGSDSEYYMTFAREAYLEYRQLDFSRPLPFGGIPGTGFIGGVTAALMAVTGLSMIGGYIVFAFVGFWGQWLAYLAFRRAVPDGHHRRYAVLVLLLPTLAFWPSALGKDAWMQMSIGVTLYGASYLAVRRRTALGVPLLVGGTLLGALVRPHIAGIVALAVIVALVLQKPVRRTSLTPVVRAVTAVLLGVGALWILREAASFVGAEQLSVADVQGALEQAGGRTSRGGSEFTPVPLLSPLGPPMAFLTVLFRPLPFDAHNMMSLLASLEGLLLLWLTWCWRASVVAAVRRMRTSMWAALCVVAVLLFVLAFAEFANFGILSRQRAQILPLFLALLCMPTTRRSNHPPHPAVRQTEPRAGWRSR